MIRRLFARFGLLLCPLPPCSFARYQQAIYPDRQLRYPESEWETRLHGDANAAGAFYRWGEENLR